MLCSSFFLVRNVEPSCVPRDSGCFSFRFVLPFFPALLCCDQSANEMTAQHPEAMSVGVPGQGWWEFFKRGGDQRPEVEVSRLCKGREWSVFLCFGETSQDCREALRKPTDLAVSLIDDWQRMTEMMLQSHRQLTFCTRHPVLCSYNTN